MQCKRLSTLTHQQHEQMRSSATEAMSLREHLADNVTTQSAALCHCMDAPLVCAMTIINLERRKVWLAWINIDDRYLVVPLARSADGHIVNRVHGMCCAFTMSSLVASQSLMAETKGSVLIVIASLVIQGKKGLLYATPTWLVSLSGTMRLLTMHLEHNPQTSWA
jgi:hypothetical protein